MKVRPFRWGLRFSLLSYRQYLWFTNYPWHKLGLYAEPCVDQKMPSQIAYSINLRRRRRNYW